MRTVVKPAALTLLALLATIPNTGRAEEDDTVSYKPASSWMLDYGEDRCRAARLFGSKEEPTILFLDQMAPTPTFSWMVAGKTLDVIGTNKRLSIRFGESYPEFTRDAGLELTLAEYGKAFRGIGIMDYSLGKDEPDAGKAKRITQLDVSEGAAIEFIEFAARGKRVRLETGSLEQIYTVMNHCMDDLIRSWGADPAIQRTVATGPKFTNLKEIARRVAMHYPRRAERLGEQTNMHFRVTVDAEGKVTNCALTNLTAATSFDDKPCEIISQYAEFLPARDHEERAVASYYSSTISFRLN